MQRGPVQASNRNEIIGRNFKGRGYFKIPQSNPDIRKLYILEPFMKVTRFYIMNLTCRIANHDGRFTGLAAESAFSLTFNKRQKSSHTLSRYKIIHGNIFMFLDRRRSRTIRTAMAFPSGLQPARGAGPLHRSPALMVFNIFCQMNY